MEAKQIVFQETGAEKRRFGATTIVPFEAREWQNTCFDRYFSDKEAHWSTTSEPFRYCVFAGTGSGKTKTAGYIASRLLNDKDVSRIVFVGPNNSVVSTAMEDFRIYFDIHLSRFQMEHHRHDDGYGMQGVAMTYQSMMTRPDIHHFRCSAERTLVIFDEVHHLGDDAAWGSSAVAAFGDAPYVISLTGTPYRGDNTEIPMVRYEPDLVNGTKVFSADFTYSLAQSVRDCVCKRPEFYRYKGASGVRKGPWGADRSLSYDDKDMSDDDHRQLLMSLVSPGHDARMLMLRDAVTMTRAENRKMIINVGCYGTGGTNPTEDATTYLPIDLQNLGLGITPDDYEIITEKDRHAKTKIKRFGRSSKWILINVDMVSEGVDIPELSVSVFLTNITGKQKTTQRIGRVLRMSGPNDPVTMALIFIFEDPEMLRIASEIEKDIAALDPVTPKSKRESAGEGEAAPRRYPIEFMPISGDRSELITVRGVEIPRLAFDNERHYAISKGYSAAESHVYALVKLSEQGDGNG